MMSPGGQRLIEFNLTSAKDSSVLPLKRRCERNVLNVLILCGGGEAFENG